MLINATGLNVGNGAGGVNPAIVDYAIFLALRLGLSTWSNFTLDDAFVAALVDVENAGVLAYNWTDFPNVLGGGVALRRRVAAAASASDTALAIELALLIWPAAIVTDDGSGSSVVADLTTRANALAAAIIARLSTAAGLAELLSDMAVAIAAIERATGSNTTNVTVVAPPSSVTIAVPTARATPSLTPSPSPPPGPFNGGAIAGIVIAALVVVAIIVFTTRKAVTRRREPKSVNGEDTNKSSSPAQAPVKEAPTFEHTNGAYAHPVGSASQPTPAAV